MEEAQNFPTMIIPNGTDVSVNEHGQLSIRTPGNLVIQNSGVYSVIESGAGSVRIESHDAPRNQSFQATSSRSATAGMFFMVPRLLAPVASGPTPSYSEMPARWVSQHQCPVTR